jgi:hypothetical protein
MRAEAAGKAHDVAGNERAEVNAAAYEVYDIDMRPRGGHRRLGSEQRMTSVVRVGAVVGFVEPSVRAVATNDLGTRDAANQTVFSVGISLFADLPDGRRITDGATPTWTTAFSFFGLVPKAEVGKTRVPYVPTEQAVREEVLEALSDDTPRERWSELVRRLRQEGIRVRVRQLDRLPLHIEFTDDLLATLRDGHG